MIVEDFCGHHEVAGAAQLSDVLEHRHADNANEFWLSRQGAFPRLAILVRGRDACVHYFPEDGHPGFVCVGDDRAVGLAQFFANAPTEKMEIGRRYVIAFESAKAAANEFLADETLPRSLEWEEL